MMRALLVVAHGSRRTASNDEVRQLTDELRAVAGDEYAQVDCAFLELAQPSIPEGINCCIAGGATEVVILPYFLSAGRHVVKDIPEIVAGSQAQHPAVTLRIAPYLGRAPSLVESLLELSKK
jgi:sirohydrochlorin ferrochelatase